MDDDLICGLTAAARYLGVSRPRINYLVLRGRLKTYPVPESYIPVHGSRPRYCFLRSDLDFYAAGAADRASYKPRK